MSNLDKYGRKIQVINRCHICDYEGEHCHTQQGHLIPVSYDPNGKVIHNMKNVRNEGYSFSPDAPIFNRTPSDHYY